MTAANAAAVKGLITLGSPHQGAPLTPLLDESTADALRVIGDWLPKRSGRWAAAGRTGRFRRAGLDGYLPPATGRCRPIAWPYPVADFAGAGTTTTGGVPQCALGGPVGGVGGVICSTRCKPRWRANQRICRDARDPSELWSAASP